MRCDDILRCDSPGWEPRRVCNMKIRCPLCSHVCRASRSGIMLPSTLTSPPRTKTSRRSAPTSRPNPITFRTLTFVIPREFSFLIRRKRVREKRSSTRSYFSKLLAFSVELWRPSREPRGVRPSSRILVISRNDARFWRTRIHRRGYDAVRKRKKKRWSVTRGRIDVFV